MVYLFVFLPSMFLVGASIEERMTTSATRRMRILTQFPKNKWEFRGKVGQEEDRAMTDIVILRYGSG